MSTTIRTPKVERFVLQDGAVFLGIFNPSINSGQGCVVSEANLAIIQATLQKACPHSQIKLIGPLAQFDRIAKVVEKFGGTITHRVDRSGPETEVFYYSDTGRARISVAARRRVMIVDDSATIRSLLTKLIARDPELELVAAAASPSEAKEILTKIRPDVITLDIHMPEMDGIQLLGQIFPKYKIPTVMLTSVGREEGDAVMRALEAGAVDYIQKPSLEELATVGPAILEKIKVASFAKVISSNISGSSEISDLAPIRLDPDHLLVIGASTGGTEAIKDVLTRLPALTPPILIAQHIPPLFSGAFAARLNQLCKFEVKEASDGDLVTPSKALIAPGGKHLEVYRAKDGQLRARLLDTAPVNRHKPSIDVLFDSVSKLRHPHVIGVILTGMGADGAKGLLNLKNSGAQTIAQDEASCVVFGMPKEAIKLGAADRICHLKKIPREIANLTTSEPALCKTKSR